MPLKALQAFFTYRHYRMTINEDAPVIARSSIQISAPLEEVWSIQASIRSWPKWQPEIAHTQVNGPLVPSTMFSWKTGLLTIESQLQEVKREEVLSWTGSVFGIEAIHTWHFEKAGNGTLVTTGESLEGILARLLSTTLRKKTEKSLDRWLEALKKAAENDAIPVQGKPQRDESQL